MDARAHTCGRSQVRVPTCRAQTNRCAAQTPSRTTYARSVLRRTVARGGSACSAVTHSTLDAWPDTG
eukprot:6918350-Alexandrium_andersonii.AAC.1